MPVNRTQKRPTQLPAEHQDFRPGRQHLMRLKPLSHHPYHKGSGKLKNKVALITGGDSGIGRAVAIAFAREGAHLVISYLDETKDAEDTKREVEELGRECHTIKGDIGSEAFCRKLVKQTLDTYDQLDILINNAAEQHPQDSLTDISAQQLERTFKTNVFGMFYLTKAALPHLTDGASVINSTSVTAYNGNPVLLDYSSTKGAIVAFTRSLALSLADKNIRVNAVAPGPIWTPLIPSTFPPEDVKQFGQNTPLGRVGQPEEVAMSYVFLASDDASYITGQVVHVNGGMIING